MTDPVPPAPGQRRWRSPFVACPALLVVAVALTGLMHHLVHDPNVVLLTNDGATAWVRVDRPFNLSPFREPVTRASFEARFTVSAQLDGADLKLTALRRAVVLIDGRPVYDTGADLRAWQTARTVRLPPLPAGAHQLRLDVSNVTGPALVQAACPALGIRTGDDGWRATDDPQRPFETWRPAIPADRPWEPPLAERFGPPGPAVQRLSPLLLGLFAVGVAGHLFATRRAARPGARWGRRVRWGLLAVWLLLAWHNLDRIPLVVGYDVSEHARYIWHVARTWRLPLPTDGWEMFHPPLYYVCSAVLYRLMRAAGMTDDSATLWLRVVPLLCGTAMVELCYRAARHLFPDREGLQAVAATVGGLLPMNLYMGQAMSNEPLAACLGGGVAVVCLGMMAKDQALDGQGRNPWLRKRVMLGLLLGLAILAKVSGLAWAVPVTLAVSVVAFRKCRATAACQPESRRNPWATAAGNVAIVLGVAAVVCGWYFVRNQIEIGVPFLSHSTPRADVWWEDPGYRTPAQFVTFGRALVRPVYGDLTGIWDDLYGTLWSDGMLNGIGNFPQRPPWHYGLMSCGLWLAVAPMAMLLAGLLVATFSRRARSGLRFAAGSVALFLAALMYICLTWPIYSCVKASYLLSVTPCLAVLAAAGFDRLAPSRAARAVATGLLVCWAGTAYLTFFAK